MNILTKSILTLAALATTGLHAETFPVLKDSFGSTVTNKIAKASGKGVTLNVNGKSAAFLDFGVKTGGYTADQVTGARLTIFFPKVTTAGNLNLSISTSGFQETFTPASIPLPTSNASFAQVPITTALTKNFVTIDVTDAVKQILNNPDEFGFTIKSDGTANCTIGSKEGSATGYPAVLEVDVDLGGAITGTNGNFSGSLNGPNFTLGVISDNTTTTYVAADLGPNNGKIPQIGFRSGAGGNGFMEIGPDANFDFVVENALNTPLFKVTQDGDVIATRDLISNGELDITGQTTFRDHVTITGNKSLTIGGTGEISIGGNINCSSTITANQSLVANNGNITANNGNILALNGKIGVGINVPATNLHVQSGANAEVEVKTTGGGSFAGIYTTNPIHKWYAGTRSAPNPDWVLSDETFGGNRITVSGQALTLGNVGIGSDPLQFIKLNVAGVVASNGTVLTSDARFKKDIVTSTLGLDTVKKLRPVSYAWRRDEFPERNFDSRRQLGFIAQEVREILPDVVSNTGDYLAVNYTEVIPVLTRAIQELAEAKDKEIATLQKSNTDLAEKLAASEARLTALTTEIQARLAKLEATNGTPAQSVSTTAAQQ